MAILRRSAGNNKKTRKPELVTGDFELHYEDIVNRNRFALVALIAFGLVLLAALTPKVADYSNADSDKFLIDIESGYMSNQDKLNIISDDPEAGGSTFIEFTR